MLGGWKAHNWHCVYIGAGSPLLDLHLVTAKSYLHILTTSYTSKRYFILPSCSSIKTSIKININQRKDIVFKTHSLPLPTLHYPHHNYTPQLHPPFHLHPIPPKNALPNPPQNLLRNHLPPRLHLRPPPPPPPHPQLRSRPRPTPTHYTGPLLLLHRLRRLRTARPLPALIPRRLQHNGAASPRQPDNIRPERRPDDHDGALRGACGGCGMQGCGGDRVGDVSIGGGVEVCGGGVGLCQ